MAADLSRLFRDIDHQRSTIAAVEAAGGEFWTVANGRVTHTTADGELTANLQGSMNHYQRRYAKEKSWLAVEVAIEQGKIPWSQTAPGYVKVGSRLEPDPKLKGAIVKAFELRAAGATVADVRDHLEASGIVDAEGKPRSYHGTQHLLRDRVYVGEIHFGTHTPNLQAHDAIVDRNLFDRAQAVKVSRGRRPKSDRLLARLGVLRCGSCGSRMVVGTANHRQYGLYRCPPTGDCQQRQTISADIAESAVAEVARQAARGPAGVASAASDARDLLAVVEDAERKLAGTVATFTAAGMEAEPEAVRRLTELREHRDQARQAYQAALAKDENLRVLLIADDWDRLDWQGKRDLITATVKSVHVVRGGTGAERLRFEMTTAAGDFESAGLTVAEVRKALSSAAARLAESTG